MLAYQKLLVILHCFLLLMPDTAPKILFLAAHVQPFLLAGINMLVKEYDARVLVVCRPVSSIAPNQLSESKNLTFLIKEDNIGEIEKRIFQFDADVVWAAGWMDKTYLKWAKRYRQMGKPTVMAMDTQWKGHFRQYVNLLLAPFRLGPVYTHAWVPGFKQKIYAEKLGFKNSQILSGLLTPDVELFSRAYHANNEAKQNVYPKALLYIGELQPHKFGNLLLAFTSLSEEERNGWQLIVIGKGPLETHPGMKNAGIDYRGFLQQTELVTVFEEAGVFCLTSSNEAWGTVIQEAAAAGMPLLISKQCGAHYSMLKDGHNGMLCDGENVTDIKDKIKKMTALPVSGLLTMGERSHELGIATNPQMWAATLMSVIKK